MICSAFCLCSQASTSSHLKDIITFRARRSPLFIGSVAWYHPSGYRSNAGMNMNYLKHSLNYLAFNWRLYLEAEGATFVPLLVDKKSLSPIPLFLWNNETVSCLWRVSQVQAMLSSCFRDLNGMKMVLYLLYFMFCLHKASEGLSLFFSLSRNWIKRHALASRSSSQISQPVRLPSVLSQTVLEPSPRLFFSALTSYSTCMKSGELIHMGLLWCWMLCKIGAFRGTWTKEITKINQ